MGREIFNTIGMAESIRYTEYKDIYSAIAELIDNSIEAQAQNIFVIIKTSINNSGQDYIHSLGVIDDGSGMDYETLQECLVFGSSTKKDRQSMGRFGVGLGQASLFAAPKVEVYSWQNSMKSKYVYLDTNKMKTGDQKFIPEPMEQEWPRPFYGFKKFKLPGKGEFNFVDHGTLVVWEAVDKINVKMATFISNLSDELGRRFRYYINDGVKIIISSTSFDPFEEVRIVDPMFLLEKSKFLGKSKMNTEITSYMSAGEPIFEPFVTDITPDGTYNVEVALQYPDKETIVSNIQIRCSVVKEKFYYGDHFKKSGKNNPGDTEIGKILKKYEKISVNRARREIQFDRFNLYDSVNDPTNRWWSLEINFEPKLDEFFKLSNNKQKVEIVVSAYDNYTSSNPQFKGKVIEDPDVDGVEEKLWIEFVSVVRRLISLAKKRNKSLMSKHKLDDDEAKETKKNGKSSVYQDTKEPNEDDFQSLVTKIVANKKDSIKVSAKLLLNELESRVKFTDNELNGNLFEITRSSKDNSESIINTNHPMFSKGYFDIEDEEVEGLTKLFIYSLIKTRHKFNSFNERKFFDEILQSINEEINELIREEEIDND